jgi:hypothetical protein
MGWEKRAGGGSYYVRKVREGKRVRSIYVGAGEAGLRAEAENRACREAKRDEPRRSRRSLLPAALVPAEPAPAAANSLPEGAKNDSGNAKKPLRSTHFIPFSVASELISALEGSGTELGEAINRLEVDEITRLLLRRKHMRGW